MKKLLKPLEYLRKGRKQPDEHPLHLLKPRPERQS
jgi:hypothetical protein